jgi:hypothetical protein
MEARSVTRRFNERPLIVGFAIAAGGAWIGVIALGGSSLAVAGAVIATGAWLLLVAFGAPPRIEP